MIQIKQIKSAIGRLPKHKATLRALGLGRIGRVVSHPDNPSIRGMIRQVHYLVNVVGEDI